MSGIPGINVIASRDPRGPCATLCRHWYGEGFCISEATHGDFCVIHRNDKAPVKTPRKPPRPSSVSTVVAPRQVSLVAPRAVWPADHREQAAMEYLGLTPTDKRLDKALLMWRGGLSLKQVREAIVE